MAHSMESRVPFLDNDLVDFGMTLPSHCRVRNLEAVLAAQQQSSEGGTEVKRQFQKTNDGKVLLREMMGELLPREIVEAQKQGFSAPDASWFRGDSIDFVKENLGGDDAPVFEYLDSNMVHSELEQHFSAKENKRLLIWSLLNVNEAIKAFDIHG